MITKKKRHNKRHYVIKAGSVEALALGCTIRAGWLVCDAVYNEWNVCWDTRAEARAVATEWNVESEAATIELLVVGNDAETKRRVG